LRKGASLKKRKIQKDKGMEAKTHHSFVAKQREKSGTEVLHEKSQKRKKDMGEKRGENPEGERKREVKSNKDAPTLGRRRRYSICTGNKTYGQHPPLSRRKIEKWGSQKR